MKNKKWIALVLLFLLLFASCDTDPMNQEGISSSTEEMTDEVDEGTIMLEKDGKAVFDIVYPNKSQFENISVWVDQIKTALKKECGSNFMAYHDGQTARSEYLILLGDTRYSESIEEISRLGIGGYSVSIHGKYIVIAATDDISMVKAVNWFCNTLLKDVQQAESDSISELIFKEKREEGQLPEKQLILAGNQLNRYSIVYSANNSECKTAATELQSMLSNKFGFLLHISSDQTPASDLEILIGKTNRAESQTHSESSQIDPMQYEYCVVNKKLSIMGFGGNGYGVLNACKYFIDNLMTETIVNLEEGYKMSKTIELKPDAFAKLTTGADVRIMTANILSEEWGGTECLPRAEILFANLMYYKPDVIGVQECSIKWTQALHTVLDSSEYEILYDKVPGTNSNYCPIIYNKNTLEIVDSGAYQLKIGGPLKARTVTWGVFKEKASGKAFIVLNTHLDWIKDANDYETTEATSHYSREMQVREIAATFADLQEKYPGVEIVMTADWNTLKNKHPLDILVELTSVKFAQDVVPNNDWGNEVDHIFVPETTKALALHLYRENGTDLGASDHPWGFIDIQLQ